MILQSLAGLPAFLVYFCTAITAVVAYLFVYTRITPHNEFELIRANEPAAAIALGLSLLGFVLPLAPFAVGSAAYALMPSRSCEPSPNVASPALQQGNADCASRSSSSSHGGSGGSSSRSSYYSSDSSLSHSSSGTSDSGSHGVQRGGFGSVVHAFGLSGGLKRIRAPIRGSHPLLLSFVARGGGGRRFLTEV